MKKCEYRTPSGISKVSGIEISHTCKILKNLKGMILLFVLEENRRKKLEIVFPINTQQED